ncbi:hypothetical protein D9M68_817670 [compost metagenome]
MLREDIKAGRVEGKLVEQMRLLPVNRQDAFLAARVNAVHDVGPGICVHLFVQTPCERHLQCSAECNEYVWAKGDEGRKEELKRQYAITVVSRRKAEELSKGDRPKKSVDWLAHNDKKLKTFTRQLADYGIESFDVDAYLSQEVGLE